MKTIKHLVIDMDGVLWHGETAIDGLTSFFEALGKLNIPFILATNNAMKIATDYSQKLKNMGVTIPSEQILTSSEATASYLKRTYPNEDTAYVIGEQGLRKAITAQGFTLLSPEAVAAGETCKLVVGGLTKASLSYDLLAMGSLLIHKGADFIASNYDSSFPTEIGPLPGAGAILSVLEISTGVKPTVIGKPNTLMFEEALRRMNATASESAMLGDRLNTDILGGQNAGMQTILVLSGVSKQEDIAKQGIMPDFICQNITAVIQALKESRAS